MDRAIIIFLDYVKNHSDHKMTLASLSFVCKHINKHLNFNVKKFINELKIHIFFYGEKDIPKWLHLNENIVRNSTLIKCIELLYSVFTTLILHRHRPFYKIQPDFSIVDIIDCVNNVKKIDSTVYVNPKINSLLYFHGDKLVTEVRRNFKKFEFKTYKKHICEIIREAKNNGRHIFKFVNDKMTMNDLNNKLHFDESFIPDDYKNKLLLQIGKKFMDSEFNECKNRLYHILKWSISKYPMLSRFFDAISPYSHIIKIIRIAIENEYSFNNKRENEYFNGQLRHYKNKIMNCFVEDYMILGLQKKVNPIQYLSLKIEMNDKTHDIVQSLKNPVNRILISICSNGCMLNIYYYIICQAT